MRNTALVILLFFAGLNIQAQKSPVDRLFDKYAGKEGFTTIYISSRMFSLIGQANIEDSEMKDIMNRLESVRILTVEDSLLDKSINFYQEVETKLDHSKYEELMVVQDGEQDLKFLIRGKQDLIEELLMIGGGEGGNVLISIKGKLNLKNISDISRGIGIDQLQNIDNKQVRKNE